LFGTGDHELVMRVVKTYQSVDLSVSVMIHIV